MAAPIPAAPLTAPPARNLPPWVLLGERTLKQDAPLSIVYPPSISKPTGNLCQAVISREAPRSDWLCIGYESTYPTTPLPAAPRTAPPVCNPAPRPHLIWNNWMDVTDVPPRRVLMNLGRCWVREAIFQQEPPSPSAPRSPSPSAPERLAEHVISAKATSSDVLPWDGSVVLWEATMINSPDSALVSPPLPFKMEGTFLKVFGEWERALKPPSPSHTRPASPSLPEILAEQFSPEAPSSGRAPETFVERGVLVRSARTEGEKLLLWPTYTTAWVAGPGWPNLPYGLLIGSKSTCSNYSISAPRTPHMIRDDWVDVTNVPPKESAEGIWGCWVREAFFQQEPPSPSAPRSASPSAPEHLAKHASSPHFISKATSSGPGWPHLPYGLLIGSKSTCSNYSISAPRTPHMIRDDWVDVTNVPPKESAEGIWGCATASDTDSALVLGERGGLFPAGAPFSIGSPLSISKCTGTSCQTCVISPFHLQGNKFRACSRHFHGDGSSIEVYPDRGEAPLVARQLEPIGHLWGQFPVGDKAFFQQEPPSPSPPHTASPSTSDTLAEHASSQMQQVKMKEQQPSDELFLQEA
ncbi:unnamed protein product [Darwinula stevensoni]|uniref:Uncharacterized protein n=1 Tax=Darwinula stevensoni TaxID=69355 RepID=A0A7R8XDW8_9CRUS|nr:unnamed protein product [Darwinula stevensoni]CAG0889086.1 unnamed protein product [Darwinula stevensoni]